MSRVFRVSAGSMNRDGLTAMTDAEWAEHGPDTSLSISAAYRRLGRTRSNTSQVVQAAACFGIRSGCVNRVQRPPQGGEFRTGRDPAVKRPGMGTVSRVRKAG